MPSLTIHQGDNLPILQSMEDACINLIYIDPPFNTGKTQARTPIKTILADDGQPSDRTGFAGKRYATVRDDNHPTRAYSDSFASDEYLAFLEPRLAETYRILAPTGSLFFHIDPRESHYCKVLLDGIFGRESFINEIIWSYDYGGRPKTRWPAKHDVILWYAKDPTNYTFNYDAIDRIPYMAPKLVGAEKAARGKTPTDVWWNTIVSPTGKEKTGYPTQKPLAILERIITVHSNPGDMILDFFAGSGTTGEAAMKHDRRCILIDENPQAIEVMEQRLEHWLEPARTDA